MEALEDCPDCRAQFLVESADTTHAYLGASASCWRVFAEVLAKEYSDPRFMKFHRWTVDAYAAQHPGKPEPRTIQSINVHLLALFLLVEKKSDPAFVTSVMGKFVEQRKQSFQWLAPPDRLGDLTVAHVVAAETPEVHGELVQQWATDVWKAWERHHSTILSFAANVS